MTINRLTLILAVTLVGLACRMAAEPASQEQDGPVVWDSGLLRQPVGCGSPFVDSVSQVDFSASARLNNVGEVQEALEELSDRVASSFPETQGEDILVRPWTLIDAEGWVVRMQLVEAGSSGNLGIDTMLAAVMPILEFTPADFMGEPTCIWSMYPFPVTLGR